MLCAAHFSAEQHQVNARADGPCHAALVSSIKSMRELMVPAMPHW